MRPPSVDTLAKTLAHHSDLAGLPHPLLVDAARAAISALRAGDAERDVAALAHQEAIRRRRALLGPVVNATGVLLHTNLGRSPGVRPAAPGSTATPAVRYSNLEFDLDSGRRGSRHSHAGSLLARACGAEHAVVVNNCASAVLLTLAALAPGARVAVSRGELVEIGGGFRIPEVLEQSGATLAEVGTTNRTRLGDYRRAVEEGATLILKVHRSNYRITGFTEEVAVAPLSGLGVPVVADIGSGLLDATLPWLAGPDGRTPPLAWLAGEPAARQTLAAGAALVTFSGDKLLGGPQAGIIAGRSDLVESCARHPLMRALRPGGLVLGALQDLALAYLRNEGDAIPFWRMAAAPLGRLADRARAVALAVGAPAVAKASEALAGGGTLPGVTIDSWAVVVPGSMGATLRRAAVPVIARMRDGCTWCDLRTVDPADDAVLVESLRRALAAGVDEAPSMRVDEAAENEGD